MRSGPLRCVRVHSCYYTHRAHSQRFIFLHQHDKHTPMFILILIGSNRNAHVLVGGDFNCGDIDWRNMQLQGSREEGVKGISALIFWNSALKIKLKGKNTLCSLIFQCWYSIYVVKSFNFSKKKLINIHQLYKSRKFS